MATYTKLLWLLVLVLLLSTVFFAFKFFGVSLSLPGSGSYYAVYLDSGDIYFGRLRRFPSLRLTDVHFLVQGKDAAGGNTFALQRLSDAVWGPTDTLRLNAKHIIWTVSLDTDSAALSAIRGGGVAPPQLQNSFPDTTPTLNDTE